MKIWSTKNGQKLIQLLSGRSNVFLLFNEDKKIMIDTGPQFMRNTLQKRLKIFGVNRIDYLVLTHTHFDHAANAHFIRENYSARVIVHESEIVYLMEGDNVRLKGTNFFADGLVTLFGEMVFSRAKYDPCPYDLSVNSYYDLGEFGFNAFIIHTPGHTHGSISIIVDNEIALVGDTMFGVFRRSIFPPFGNDKKLIVESWGKLLDTGCELFLSGHGWADNRKLVEKEYHRKRQSNFKL